MSKLITRSLSLVIVASFCVLGLVPLVALAPAAHALGTCAPGTVTLPSGLCVSLSSGDVTGTPVAVTPEPVNMPSSALAAANGTSVTSEEAVGGVLLNEEVPAGEASMLGSALPTGALIIGGALGGYQLGKAIDSTSCSLGLSMLCTPKPSSSFVPNVGITVADPGWVSTASSAFRYALGGSSYGTGSATWGSGTGMTIQADGTGVAEVVVNLVTASSGAASIYEMSQCYDGGSGLQSDLNVVSGTAISAGTSYTLSGNAGGTCGSPYDDVYRIGVATLVPDGSTCTSSGGDWLNPWCVMGWYGPPGSPARPSGGSANPERQWQMVKTCTPLTGGGAATVLTATSADFTETDSTFPSVPDPGLCPAGTSLTQTKVTELTTGGSSTDVWTVNVPLPLTTTSQTYPGCETTTCHLGLAKIAGGTDLGDCFAEAGRCQGWFADPDKATNYQCTYDGAILALSECNVYSPTFDVDQQAKGIPYGDPATGTVPSSIGDTDTSTVGIPGSSGPSCYPSGWSAFNPLEWVLKPVECALVWAFVPDAATLHSFTDGISTSYNNSSMGQWFAALGGVGAVAIPSGGGCGGVNLHIPALGLLGGSGYDVSIFGTCTEPWATLAGIVKAFLIVMIAWGTCVAVFRNVSRSFGYDPAFGGR
jgi:hypothetical protein